MVGPVGHYGAALLAAAVVVRGLSRRQGVALTLVVLLAAMLPDVDGSLPWLAHRGVTHTLWFGVGVAVAGGLVAAGSYVGYRRVARRTPNESSSARVFALAAVGLFVGVLSHLAADALTILPPGEWSIRPLRPVVERRTQFEILPPFSTVSNVSLLLAGVAAWLLAFAGTRPTRDGEERLQESR